MAALRRMAFMRRFFFVMAYFLDKCSYTKPLNIVPLIDWLMLITLMPGSE
jgi:hypothetical protein